MSQLERLTPQNLEAEQSFLGSLLLDKDAIIKVADMLQPDDFYNDKHRRIYEAMIDLYRKSDPIDLLSLGNRLQEKGELEQIGGRAELISLANAVPTASHVVHYGEIIQKKATMRRLLQAAGEITALGYDQAEDVAVLLDQAESKLFNVSQKFLKRSFTPIRDVLSDAFERIDELHREKGKRAECVQAWVHRPSFPPAPCRDWHTFSVIWPISVADCRPAGGVDGRGRSLRSERRTVPGTEL